MYIWISIILLVILFFYFFKKNTESFQNQTTDDNSPPINLNATVPDSLVNQVVDSIGVDINNVDASGIPVEAYNRYKNESVCNGFIEELNFYNSELQRHRNEGNWEHTKAIKSYINIVKQRQVASSCPTN